MHAKAWPANGTERLIGYAFAILTAVEVSLIGVLATDGNSPARVFLPLTAVLVLITPILLDTVVQNVRGAPVLQRWAAVVAAFAYCVALLVVFVILWATGHALFRNEPGPSITLTVLYTANTLLLGGWLWIGWRVPQDQRPYWQMELKSAR